MEEGEYRSTYHSVNQQQCQYEKAILTRSANCSHAHRFCLADREGVACKNSDAIQHCKHLLGTLREKAIFALQITRMEGPLPHAKEIKVQLGGLNALVKILERASNDSHSMDNIYELICRSMTEYGSIESLPYDEITRYITQYQPRKRSRKIRG